MSNRRVVLESRPGVNGDPCEGNFACLECPYPSADLKLGEVLIKTCYLSVDPALRCMMNEDPGVNYLPGWNVKGLIVGLNGVGSIVKSNHPEFFEGDLIQSFIGWPWQEVFVQAIGDSDKTWQKVDSFLLSRPSLSLHLLVALTSIIGIWEKGHINPNGKQTFVVSGAAGACGSIAGQVARDSGCKDVVGICGTDEKCSWLMEELNFTAAINYKTHNVSAELERVCPDGIDVYFDNVGGDISDTVIRKMNKNAHVILCGQISQYNKDIPYPPPLNDQVSEIVELNNISRDRFTVVNYPDQFEEATKLFVSSVLAGKLKVKETVAEGLERTGAAFVSMMKGGNMGKQIVHVADP